MVARDTQLAHGVRRPAELGPHHERRVLRAVLHHFGCREEGLPDHARDLSDALPPAAALVVRTRVRRNEQPGEGATLADAIEEDQEVLAVAALGEAERPRVA